MSSRFFLISYLAFLITHLTTYGDLTELANQYKTDKGSTYGSGHHYTRHYTELFSDLENSSINLLEIGVQSGASIKM